MCEIVRQIDYWRVEITKVIGSIQSVSEDYIIKYLKTRTNVFLTALMRDETSATLKFTFYPNGNYSHTLKTEIGFINVKNSKYGHYKP